MSNLKLVSEEELLLLPQQDCVRFALFCAEQVRDSWKGIPECVSAIETAERWLEGKASVEECKVAAYAAYDAAYYAAYAAYAAVHAARAVARATRAAVHAANAAYAADASHAAAYAAYANGKPHLIDAQWEYYNELLHFDDIAEKLLLGESV